MYKNIVYKSNSIIMRYIYATHVHTHAQYYPYVVRPMDSELLTHKCLCVCVLLKCREREGEGESVCVCIVVTNWISSTFHL